MPSTRASASVSTAAFVLLLLSFPAQTLAQQVKVSLRVAPLGSLSTSPLFVVDVIEAPSRRGVTLPSLTVTDTASGPQLANLALALPVMTINRTSVTSRFGDQQLPQTFLVSPLSGDSVHAPMRGVSFSTAGATPWTVSIGQLDTASYTGVPTSSGPSVVALAVNLAPYRRLSVAPRLLVPVRSKDRWHTSIGTAIRADVMPRVAFVSDVGAADGANGGWAPLASAGLLGHWAGTEVETSVLRGAPSFGAQDMATVGSVDRELARARMRPLSGLTLSGLVSWSRPASAARTADTTLGSVGVVYDRLPYGQLAATREHELTSSRAWDTTRLEWRHQALRGLTIRYTDRRDANSASSATDHASRLLEVDVPSLTPQHVGGRLNLRAALAANPYADGALVSSRVSGRVAVADDVALVGETELELARSDGGQRLRALRLTTDVAVMRGTAVQVLCTYRAGMPFSIARAFEARISRTIELSSW
ncbi:MAG TPA: hypothetical protein VIX63_17965 [Vicinamibacterales bacterium]